MKRLVLFLLAVLFCLSLVLGCGKKQEEAQPEATPTEETTTPAPTTTDTGTTTQEDTTK